MVKLTRFHRDNIVKLIKKRGIDEQTIDITAEWDSSLSLEENYNKFKKLIGSEAVYQKDEVEAITRQLTREEEVYHAELFSKKIEELKKSEVSEISHYYKNYYSHIDSFLDNKLINGMFVVGTGGIGKSFNLLMKLNERKVKFFIIKGHISPLAFYRFLHEHKDNDVIVIDDVVKLIKSEDIIALLLGAIDCDNKLVEWTSNSPLTRDLPKYFNFNSKVFILANQVQQIDEFIQALKDRCVFYELRFSREQMFEMLYILARKHGYSPEVVDYIRELSEKNIIKNLSLRLIHKLSPYHSKPDWKNLVTEIIEVDKDLNPVFELMRSGKTVKEQIKEFFERTGMSRATFYRCKAKMGCETV